jgi:LacI family transcriptional regulator
MRQRARRYGKEWVSQASSISLTLSITFVAVNSFKENFCGAAKYFAIRRKPLISLTYAVAAPTCMAKSTISDVAREAGVSTMTVSRVLNGRGEISQETRERVQSIIDRLNYRPSSLARSFKTQSTQTIGLIIPDITNPFFPDVVRAVEDFAFEEDFGVILCNTVRNAERERKALRLLEDLRVSGTILCSSGLSDEVLIPLLKQHPAVVVFDRAIDKSIAGSVFVDDVYGAVAATNHLLATGRRRLAFLAGPPYYPSSGRRRYGVEVALEMHGVKPDPQLEIVCEPDEASGFETAKSLLERYPDTDGIICYNDLIALGALEACKSLGVRVPQQVALIGFDDIRLASIATPSLSTVRVDRFKLGRAMVEMLLERMRQSGETPEKMIRPELVIRETAPLEESTEPPTRKRK